jgi:hypothetical protein
MHQVQHGASPHTRFFSHLTCSASGRLSGPACRNKMAIASDAKSVDADVFVDQQIAEHSIKRTAGW